MLQTCYSKMLRKEDWTYFWKLLMTINTRNRENRDSYVSTLLLQFVWKYFWNATSNFYSIEIQCLVIPLSTTRSYSYSNKAFPTNAPKKFARFVRILFIFVYNHRRLFCGILYINFDSMLQFIENIC